MTIGCNIWMICLILIWFFYGLSRMFQLPHFVWALRSSVWDVFIKFLLIDATDRSKTSSDQTSFYIALSLYPLSFFANTPFKAKKNLNRKSQYFFSRQNFSTSLQSYKPPLELPQWVQHRFALFGNQKKTLIYLYTYFSLEGALRHHSFCRGIFPILKDS